MTQTIENIVIKQSSDIAKSLESTRDLLHQNLKEGLYYQTTTLYLNNFYTRYCLLLYGLIEEKLDEGISNEILYKKFINIRGDSRYLIELYITTCHFLNLPDSEKENSCISLRLAELLHIHKQDKIIDEFKSTIATKSKLGENQLRYQKISTLAKKYLTKELPPYIDDCSPLSRKEAGLKTCYSHGKIQYAEEFKENKIITESLEEVGNGFGKLSAPLYSLYSLYEHPTYTSVESLNDFIKLSKEQKKKKIEEERFTLLSMAKPVAKAMEISCKKYLLDK
ncbi:hypothetical protein N9L18_00630 [Candidatus Pacebacteria bacterium]|nr:hypothetical protein [Candidatus Paceibacterota bacterium]